jgi:hypothetical protein
MSIANYIMEGTAIVLSPLSAYLVFRYLKDHVRDLHEDMRKLITDSATITRKTVYSVQEDLSKVSLKDHGDTRVFEKQLADKVLAATNDAKEVIRSEAYIATADMKATVDKLHTEVLNTLDAAKEDIKVLVGEASTVAQRSSIEISSGIQSAIRQSSRDATALQALENTLHAEAKASAEALHETLIEGVSTSQSVLKSAIDSSHEVLKKTVQDNVDSIRGDFSKAVSIVQKNTAQAVHERLNIPTAAVDCVKCGRNVVRYNEHNVCANCW